jgi:nucleotide-binding universal stress UspA family protein
MSQMSITAPRTGCAVVVGVDGSPGAAAALEWAADEAHHRGCELVIVHAIEYPDRHTVATETTDVVERELGQHADRVLSWSLKVARERQPALITRIRRVPAAPVHSLVECSASAQLLVLGRQGVHRGFDSALGGISHHVAAYAWCPVVVVPCPPVPGAAGGVIAVGVEPGRGGCVVLDEAFACAERRHARVLAVLAVPGEADRGEGYRALAATARTIAADHPAVPMNLHVEIGFPGDVLLNASCHADLLMLGINHLGDRRLSRLSWPAATLLARSQCPVEIVGWSGGRPPDAPWTTEQTEETWAPARLSATK